MDEHVPVSLADMHPRPWNKHCSFPPPPAPQAPSAGASQLQLRAALLVTVFISRIAYITVVPNLS